jgi:RND family efflux transporter MFP subunit
LQDADQNFAVIEAKTTTANLTNSYPATIKGKQDVEIRPMVSGFITKLHVDEGATVRKGQVLFSIDPVQYQAAVNSAKAAVETAKAAVNTQELTVNNKRELNKKNIISDYDLQMAENQLAQTKAQLAQANAQLVNAKNNLSYTSVTSPSDGVVGSIPYRVGSLVTLDSSRVAVCQVGSGGLCLNHCKFGSFTRSFVALSATAEQCQATCQ